MDHYSKSKKSVNLLAFCRRALAEWPGLDIVQGKLINVEKDFPLFQPNNNELLVHKQIDLKQEFEFDISTIPRSTLEKLKCTRLTQIEFADITQKEATLQEIVTFDDFVRPPKNDYPRSYGGYDKQKLASIGLEEKSKLFWGTKLRGRDAAICVGILSTVPTLIEKGFKYWELPTGDKVPLNDLKLLWLEVVPDDFIITRTIRYETLTNECGVYAFREADDDAWADRTPKVPIWRIGPEVGAVFLYTVLGIHIPSSNSSQEKLYAVDPTSLQFGKAGPKGSLIHHGWWEDFETGFPGRILLKEDYKGIEYDRGFLKTQVHGEGPRMHATRLGNNLIRYLDRKGCEHCGKVEGIHLENPRPDRLFKHPSVELFKCSKCKSVEYCGRNCQILNWPGHKKNCKKAAQ